MNAEQRRYAALGTAIAGAAIAAWVLLPRDPIAAGKELARQGRLEKALAVWERACRSGKPDIEACATAADARLRRGERAEAVALVETARAAEPEHLRVLLLLGAIAQVDGKPEEARATWERADSLHPSSGLPAANLGMLALEEGDPNEAERWAERAIAADPALGMGHAVRARVHAAAGNPAAAMDDYLDALERDPGSVEVRLELADLLAESERWELRLELLKEARPLAPGDPRVLSALGETQHALGDIEAARETLRLACDLAPEAAAPRVTLALVYLELGQPQFAAPRLREALALEPDHPDAKHFLAEALAEDDELDASLAILDEIVADASLVPVARIRSLFLRAQIHAERGATGTALEDTAEILKLSPEHAGASWVRGRLLLEAGRLAEAEPLLRVAITPSEDAEPNPRALFDWARLRVRQGNGKEALAVLVALDGLGGFDRKMLDVHPEFRALADDEDFRLFLEGASPPAPAGPEEP